jgi:multimeric flavodoxin WrbA
LAVEKKRGENMKVLVLNSSPKMDKGNTALVLNPFLEGMREAGAEVDIFYIKKLKINPCQGEGNCVVKTPGECFQKDDMQMLYPMLRDADIWVLAMPVHFCGIPGPMKNLIDRMCPLWDLSIELYDGHCSPRPRKGSKDSKIVLVSSCGYWEMDNFDLILDYLRTCRLSTGAFVGALLRPHADALRPMMEDGAPLDDIFEAAREAGRQLVRDGAMSPETLGIISRELMPLEEYVDVSNQAIQEALDALGKK